MEAKTNPLLSPETSFPIARECPFKIPETYTERRDHQPMSKVVMSDGRPAWLATRYEDVRAILVDSRFSSNRGDPGFPTLVPGQVEGLARQAPFMINMDGERHSMSRKSVISEFSVRRVAELRTRIQGLIDSIIDAMVTAEDRQADLVEAVSLPVPSQVICDMVGITYEQHEYFRERTARLVWRGSTTQDRIDISNELRTYMHQLLTEKEQNPADDLLTRQIRDQREKYGEFDAPGLCSLVLLLLIAGHETSANMISLSVFSLLTNDDLRRRLTDDPDSAPAIVEELLRFYSIIDFGPPRLALEDVEVGGVVIKKGEGVIASGLAANRDPAVFPDPEDLDPARGASHHVAFGYGPHQCLGQNLSRLELQIVLETLFRRLPTLSLGCHVDDLKFKNDGLIYGLYELPVAW